MGKIAIFIAAAIIATTPAIASLNANGQRDITSTVGEGEPWFCDSKLLMDAPRANNLGWNPGENRTAFTIQDDCYVKNDSIVLLNVNDGGVNFEACNVDYIPGDSGAFEVYCSSPPAEGSELHYTILVDYKEVIAEEIEETAAEIPGRQQNSTQQ